MSTRAKLFEFECGFEVTTIQQWWYIDSPVQSCALSYPSTKLAGPSSLLELVAEILNGEYVFPNVREGNGTYQVGVAQNRECGTFSLFSSRSTNIEIDVDLLSRAFDWFINEFTDRSLFQSYCIKWLRPNRHPFSVPYDQIANFTYRLTGSTQIESEVRSAPCLSDLKVLVKHTFMNKEFSCVVSARILSSEFVAKYCLEKHNVFNP